MTGPTPPPAGRRPPPRDPGRIYRRVGERRPLEVVDLSATIDLLEQALVVARKWHARETTQDPTDAQVSRARLGERNVDLSWIAQLAGAARSETELEALRLRGRDDPRDHE